MLTTKIIKVGFLDDFRPPKEHGFLTTFNCARLAANKRDHYPPRPKGEDFVVAQGCKRNQKWVERRDISDRSMIYRIYGHPTTSATNTKI